MSDTSVPISQAPRSAPDFIHELFWGAISAQLGEQLQRVQPSMGTISGVGTNLLVLPDGSAVPRTMAYKAGQRYKLGDRVVFGPVKGQPVVYGSVITAIGAGEAVIGTADILDGAITQAKISSSVSLVPPDGSITSAKLATASVSTAKLQDLSITNEKLGLDCVMGGNIAPNSIGGTDIQNGTITGNKLADNYSLSSHSHSNYDDRLDRVCLSQCGRRDCNSANCPP